jgi:uncharacterized protein YegP (UPF0339 family)
VQAQPGAYGTRMMSDPAPTLSRSPPVKERRSRGDRGNREKGVRRMSYFKIVTASGGYRAQFWSGGNLVWWTEVYVSKAGAQNAIDTIRRHGSTAQQKAA